MFLFQVIDDFVQSVKDTDISIISQEIFQHNPQSRVENLKVILQSTVLYDNYKFLKKMRNLVTKTCTHMDLVATKPVFGVSDKARLKTVS